MLKFANLTLSQQKCVVALIEHTPSLTKDGRITLKEVVAITQELAAKRTAGGVKIGYPNWLFKSNKVEKGVYQLPVPTAQELSDFAQASAPKTKVAKVKTVKVKTPKVTAKSAVTKDTDSDSRLQRIIGDSEFVDEDVEDFNQILRDNGIEV
jgi:hypothetical protein